MFGTTTIVTRLKLGFAAVLVLLLAVSAASLARLADMNDGVQAIVDTYHPQIVLANEAMKLTIDNGRQLRSMLLANSETEREPFRAAVQANLPRIATALEAMDRMAPTGESRRLYQEITEKQRQLAGKYARLNELARGERQPAITFLLTEFYTANNAYWAALEAMADYQAGQVAIASQSTHTAFLETRRLILALAVEAIAAGLLIAYRIVNTVAQRLARQENRAAQAEQDAAQKRKEVTHLARVAMLGELSGAMAHELNQPLTAMLINAGAAQLFLSQRADPSLDVLRDIMQDIVEEDRRAGDIIKHLRGLFGKSDIVRQPLAVNDLVFDVARVLRNDLINHSVTLHTDLTPDLPAVLADRVQLQQVLINLVLNACDAMDGTAAQEREITVRTAGAGNTVLMTVSDCGSGIEPGDMEKIFDSFYTTKERGMGLGLSICRSIVGANGGRLWAENNPGRGASFHFSLQNHAVQR